MAGQAGRHPASAVGASGSAVAPGCPLAAAGAPGRAGRRPPDGAGDPSTAGPLPPVAVGAPGMAGLQGGILR